MKVIEYKDKDGVVYKNVTGHKVIIKRPAIKKEPIPGTELRKCKIQFSENGKLVSRIVEMYRPIGDTKLDP